jgi:hypothetical protein
VVGRYQDKRRQTGANGQGRSEGEPLLLHPPSCLLTGPLGRESIRRCFTCEIDRASCAEFHRVCSPNEALPATVKIN